MSQKTSKLAGSFKNITGYQQFGLIVGMIGLLVIARFITPTMFSWNSAHSMLQNNAVFALLAVGIMFVLLTGGIDLSIGSTLGMTGVITSMLMVDYPDVPAFVWVILSLLIGGACGLINGLLVGKLRMIPMIVTLGTMYIYRGLAFLISKGGWVFPHKFTDNYKAFASGKTFGLYNIIWISVIIFVLAGIFLAYTRPGRKVYAIGTNAESAKIAGINEGNVKLMAYTLCGAIAGLAGMLYTANYAISNSTNGTGFEMQAIAICILGGVSIVGGKGRIDGVIIGVIMMSIIYNFISMLPGLSVWQDAIGGTIIIIAVALNIFTGKLFEKRALKERSALI